ncbi:TetR/AcrR family transcriptional regulator [Streptomyces sp. NPDC058417]|uniref:TetR/AcrR family transcriptional regulator n=1 Tax=unclassified Streptomyces TaxID=2593676 RepID=UPI0036475297
MATPKGEATKRRILDAAVDLLIAGGAARLSLDDVLRTTATSKGQLFSHFPGGKDELRRAATELQVRRLIDHGTPGPLATWDDWEAWFGQIIALHVRQTREDACEVAALAGRALDADPTERALIGRVFTQWDTDLRERLDTLRTNGLLRPDAPVDQLSSLIIAVLQGGAVMDRATASTAHLTHALQQTMTLLRGYAPAD